MATVDGYTKDKMDEIVDDTVTGAHISGDNLILEKHDGSVVNAGNVRGPAGPVTAIVCTSTTRPSSPANGTMIFETDTFKTLIYYTAKGGWFPPWNTAWGIIGKHRLITNSAVYSADTNTDMVVTGVVFRSDRQYEIGFDGEAGTTGTGIWTLEASVNAGVVGRLAQINTPVTANDFYSGKVLYTPGSNGTWTVRIYAQEYSGTATFQMNAAAGTPRILSIKDVGPV